MGPHWGLTLARGRGVGSLECASPTLAQLRSTNTRLKQRGCEASRAVWDLHVGITVGFSPWGCWDFFTSLPSCCCLEAPGCRHHGRRAQDSSKYKTSDQQRHTPINIADVIFSGSGARGCEKRGQCEGHFTTSKSFSHSYMCKAAAAPSTAIPGAAAAAPHSCDCCE